MPGGFENFSLSPVAFQPVTIKLSLAARWRYIFQLLLTGNWLPQSCLSEIRWPSLLKKAYFPLRASERWNSWKKREDGADEAFHWLLYWDEMFKWNTWCLADYTMDLGMRMIDWLIENIDSTTITDEKVKNFFFKSHFHSGNKKRPSQTQLSFKFGKWKHIFHVHWRWVS